MRQPFLDLLSERVVLFDGGTGTVLYSRGVFFNRCYEELNLTKPELVAEVHRAFALAGADVVETNTFSASRPRLEKHGLGEKVREINRSGALLARQAIGNEILVAGSVGPLGIRLEPWGPTTVSEAEGLFREQIEGLMEGGVDLLVLETFSDLVEIQAAIKAAEAVGSVPFVALMTVDEEGRTPEGVPPEWVAQKLAASSAAVVGVNCSVGPAAMLSVVETMARVIDKPLAALPNAGMPRSIESRMHYLANSDYMARYALRFVEAGARVVGGCCGVMPEHIRSMRDALGRGVVREVAPRVTVEAPRALPRPEVPQPDKSSLGRKIAGGQFVGLIELPPPRGWSSEERRDLVRALVPAGLDGVLVSDDPRAQARMSPLAMARLVIEESGGRVEPVLQYSCRDRNLLGMQSDLLGAHALGIRNLMLVTGRAPRLGEAFWATQVFDVDAIGLTNVVFRLNHGLDVGDNPIGDPTAFLVGGLVVPGAPDSQNELERLGWKIDAGAEFLITTPVFDGEGLKRFLGAIEPFRVPVLATVWPPRSLGEAEFLAEEMPGVQMPAEFLARIAAAGSPEGEVEVSLDIARELIEQIHPLVEGIVLSGKLARDPRALDLLKGYLGRPVTERRSFPGRPGVKGGAEGVRFRGQS